MLRKANIQYLAEYPRNWVDIPGYEGQFAAFHKGAILNRATNYVLANQVFKNGYVYVTLASGGKKINKSLHRLIAKTFIPNPDNKPEVNHKTGNKKDNHAALLEWATVSENKRHAFQNGLNKGSKPWLGKTNEAHVRSKPILQITRDGSVVKCWPSIAEAVRHGYQSGNICKVAQGERATHKGFIWKYFTNQ